MAMTENQALVMRAFITLTATTPSKADYQYVLDHFNIHGKEASIQVLNNLFASYTDEQLAQMLLNTTYLNTIDLEGDGNTDNMGIATKFIRDNAGNRIGAMLDLARQLSEITNGPLAPIAQTYNTKINTAYQHITQPNNSEHSGYKFLNGSEGNDVIFADNSGWQYNTIKGQNQATRAIWVLNTEGQIPRYNPETKQIQAGDSSQKLADLKGPAQFPFAPSWHRGISAFTSLPSWQGELRVSYRNITSKAIALDDLADYKTDPQDINRAIKQAIQGDARLSHLLAVEDGPEGTLKVFAKVDGEHGERALSIDVLPKWSSLNAPKEHKYSFAYEHSRLSPIAVDCFFNTIYDREVSKEYRTIEEVRRTLFSSYLNFINSAYEPLMGRSDNDLLITGEDSQKTDHHVIDWGRGNDLIVLSSNRAAPVGDIVQFHSAFGHDTILNFVPGQDKLDFGLLHKSSQQTVTELSDDRDFLSSLFSGYDYSGKSFTVDVSHEGPVKDGRIRIVGKRSPDGETNPTTYNASAEDVKQLFTDMGTTHYTDEGVKLIKQLYITVDPETGAGDVYQVVDYPFLTANKSNIEVTLLGSIALASDANGGNPGSKWFDLALWNSFV